VNAQISLKPGFSAVEKGRKRTLTVLTVLLLLLAILPGSVHACAACYGQSDSPLASGVTWGILSLLAVVMTVLGSIVTFFVYINRKSPVAENPITDYQSPATNH
jgi:uncharacterized membrane protein (DUF485 family)